MYIDIKDITAEDRIDALKSIGIAAECPLCSTGKETADFQDLCKEFAIAGFVSVKQGPEPTATFCKSLLHIGIWAGVNLANAKYLEELHNLPSGELEKDA